MMTGWLVSGIVYGRQWGRAGWREGTRAKPGNRLVHNKVQYLCMSSSSMSSLASAVRTSCTFMRTQLMSVAWVTAFTFDRWTTVDSGAGLWTATPRHCLDQRNTYTAALKQSAIYSTSWLPGFARVPYYASTQSLLSWIHHVSCHVRYSWYTRSKMFTCNSKVSMVRAPSSLHTAEPQISVALHVYNLVVYMS